MRRFKWVGDGDPIPPTRYTVTEPNSAGNVFVEIDDSTDEGKREADGLARNGNYDETKTSQKQASTSETSTPAQEAPEGEVSHGNS